MTDPLRHPAWFEDTGTTLQTSDGKQVKILGFNHQDDEEVLQEWASHFRSHYVSEEDLDSLSKASGKTRADYLRDIIFPGTTGLGPAVRSGDFSEILVADYIELIAGYTIPRTRYDRKATRDSSTQSIDVLGFKVIGNNMDPQDELITCEIKASLTAPARNGLQIAIDDSKKDFDTRLPFALNAARQRLKDRDDTETMLLVERFMNVTANPYKNITAAVFMCTNAGWKESLVTEVIAEHPNENLSLLVFTGEDLMVLANRLYEISYATA